jgi:hypothetical protein
MRIRDPESFEPGSGSAKLALRIPGVETKFRIFRKQFLRLNLGIGHADSTAVTGVAAAVGMLHDTRLHWPAPLHLRQMNKK